MWFNFFSFEIKYRLRQPETYLFFLLLFLFSMVGVEFVFQGIDLGLVRKNSPLVIAKTMAAITGLSMIMTSMIMGVPILRDFQHDVASLIYVNPVSKKSYLGGRFLGSFAMLLLIFSGIPLGMILGELMPWTDQKDLLAFQLINYTQPFLWVVLPTLFFGAAIFFVTGALSKKLIVVYTQGVIIFVLFMITKGITDKDLQALLDPFSLTALTRATEDWTINDRNGLLVPVNGTMLANKVFWMGLGILALIIGYKKFQLRTVPKKTTNKNQQQTPPVSSYDAARGLPLAMPVFNRKATIVQLLLTTWFHTLSILKLTSFWAIVICCFIVISINSVSLGTSHGVDSYPTTYLMIEELQEMSLYFFMIMLAFYSGEIMWKERDAKFDLIHDATPLSSFINVVSRFLALLSLYSIVMLSLIIGGILFQTWKGYHQYDLGVYFVGFFLELLPLMALYTFAALFFQALTGNKFTGIFATIAFAVVNVAVSTFGTDHPLLNFGGHSLTVYSDMSGYGHFLTPYLWVKLYWALFGLLLLILASVLMPKGNETRLKIRWTRGLSQSGKAVKVFSLVCLSLFILTGAYIFYNTNVLHEFWTKHEQARFRADYEKTLKKFEYIPQPKIIAIDLKIDLFPSKRSYAADARYTVVNTALTPIREIHLQKRIASKVTLTNVIFNRTVTPNHAYEKFHYIIYELDQPLAPHDTLKLTFTQTYQPEGFEAGHPDIDLVYNGTFFDNAMMPGFGYQKKYELQDNDERRDFALQARSTDAGRDEIHELVNARNGSDSDGVMLDAVISTEYPQTALTSGDLAETWSTNGRNYFHYKTSQPIIHFYPIISGNYEVMRDSCVPAGQATQEPVALEIYHHRGHEYNLQRMMESMKMSLDYYSVHFSPYQYGQLRIVEFPRYRTFAQSLPGIIPFSEALGFMMNIDNEKDLDMVFYITAHEVAHQWWGMQLEAANVQGQNMILETLAQYSAMMVLRKKYGDKKVQQFLTLQRDEYRKARLKSDEEEPPLVLVGNESYVYYNKGALSMYEWQKNIGEENANMALRNFLKKWRSFDNTQKPDRYATTLDLIQYFREVTPDSMQHVVTDLFERSQGLQ